MPICDGNRERRRKVNRGCEIGLTDAQLIICVIRLGRLRRLLRILGGIVIEPPSVFLAMQY